MMRHEDEKDLAKLLGAVSISRLGMVKPGNECARVAGTCVPGYSTCFSSSSEAMFAMEFGRGG